MKTVKYFVAIALLAGSLSACSSNSAGNNENSKTLGGSVDTMNAVAGSNAGGTNPASSSDTSNNGNKNRGKDSTSNGNANPNGRGTTDTSKQTKKK